ncbi:hypothetical protein [Bradyrhizobium sp.]|jgi:hypothetical protein|uniref:hypothetical protein n=1 Tax=Bradyrhizobium sp. TaxID=376 RepID=UPI003C180101
MKNSFEWLQPLIDALRTTDLGRPKAQAAFNRNLEVLNRFQAEGYTYPTLANVLADQGVNGKKAKFSAQSLYNYHKRAKAYADKTASDDSPHSAAAKRDDQSDNQGPTNKSPPNVKEFMRKIREAGAHSTKNAILHRRGSKDI